MKTTLFALGLVLGLPAAAFAHDSKAHHADASATTTATAPAVQIGDLAISEAWARATPPRAPVGGAYLTITNAGASGDRLTGGSVRTGETVSIHEMIDQDGRMLMRPLDGGLEIPANAAVALAPGAHHLMIEGLTAPLVAGETVTLTLTFERAGAVEVPFEIRPLRARAASPAGQDAKDSDCGEGHDHGSDHKHGADHDHGAHDHGADHEGDHKHHHGGDHKDHASGDKPAHSH